MSEFEGSTTDAVDTSTNPVTTSEVGDTGESVGTGINPSWEPILQLADPRVHEAMKTHLKTWDDNYRRDVEAAKSAAAPTPEPSPYDEFQGVDPANIRAALQITETISQDPRRVAQLLADELGLSLSEAKAAVAEAQQQQEQQVEFSEDDDPRLKQMHDMFVQQQQLIDNMNKQQQERFQHELQRQEAQQREREVQVANQQVERELNDLFKENPGLKDNADPQFMDLLWLKAGHLANQGDKTPLKTAYNQLSGFTNSIKQNVAPKPTPLFVPTGGQAPPVQESGSKDRRTQALEMLQALHANPGQG